MTRGEEYRATDSPTVWKRCHLHKVLRCDRCRPHRHDNASRQPRRSWKQRRKTRARVVAA